MADTNEKKNALAAAVEQSRDKTVKIGDKTYNINDLSEEARNQMVNLRVVEQEIARLNQLLAIAQTARNAYAQALGRALPNDDKAESVQ